MVLGGEMVLKGVVEKSTGASTNREGGGEVAVEKGGKKGNKKKKKKKYKTTLKKKRDLNLFRGTKSKHPICYTMIVKHWCILLNSNPVKGSSVLTQVNQA